MVSILDSKPKDQGWIPCAPISARAIRLKQRDDHSHGRASISGALLSVVDGIQTSRRLLLPSSVASVGVVSWLTSWIPDPTAVDNTYTPEVK